jgi:hypothetical protein
MLAHLLRCVSTVCFFPFCRCVSCTCLRSKQRDQIGFCGSGEIASRNGRASVNTVNNGAVENSANGASCGGSSRVRCVVPSCQ